LIVGRSLPPSVELSRTENANVHPLANVIVPPDPLFAVVIAAMSCAVVHGLSFCGPPADAVRKPTVSPATARLATTPDTTDH
jgi:hypothetical protein